ncbi:MAG TPA: undecaprenyl-diphosphate phosphatase [Actinomycetota bacterium]|nr:undecaprenyl-diphosphate phosphatase [Actinomycetota bacterium]
MITYLQAIVMGITQGITELFPISSLAQAVILPTVLGWDNLANAQAQPESFFLAFLVGLHVATATALLIYFWSDWRKIIGGFFRTLGTGARERKLPWSVIRSPDQRLAWLLIVATIPAGLTGLIFEHAFRVTFAKPLFAAVFLMVNGVILFVGERFRRRAEVKAVAASHGTYEGTEFRRLDTLEFREALFIGVSQIFALIAGISRSGITMVAGLVRGLSHEDAARFSFLLATPIILAAGILKLPDLFGTLGNGIRGQVIVGSICAGVAAYFSVRFLMKYFETKTLTPFAIFCLVEGALCTIAFLVAGKGF